VAADIEEGAAVAEAILEGAEPLDKAGGDLLAES
jgi:hypothetical protein